MFSWKVRVEPALNVDVPSKLEDELAEPLTKTVEFVLETVLVDPDSFKKRTSTLLLLARPSIAIAPSVLVIEAE